MHGSEIRTLTELYQSYVARNKSVALMEKRDGAYAGISTSQLDFQVRSVSCALVDLGLREGDRVAILMENRPEWLMTDYATLAAGGVTVPLYPTLTAEQIAYILKDSGASFVFVSNRMQLEKILQIEKECTDLLATVIVDPGGFATPNVMTFNGLIERGRATVEMSPKLFDQRAANRKPDDLATIIYTSGTTGEPKGVMLTHANLVTDLVSCMKIILFDSNFVALSFLPLSHVYERMVDYAYFYCGLTIAYAESVEKLPLNLLEVRPHVFVAVPRVYEKMHAKILAGVESSGFKKLLFKRALVVSKRYYEFKKRKEEPPALLRLMWKIFDRLAYSKVKEKLGGRFQYCLSGGAPLSAELGEFFGGMGIRILEGYGMTETSPVISCNTLNNCKIGTVGKILPSVEVRFAQDGEIIVRGPNVMKGYWNKPEATREVLSADGWLSTGDIGHLDEEGYLLITDRKKELIVDAYGKNIAPQPIENALKMCPWIGQAVIVGDRRPFVSALIVPDFDKLKVWGEHHGIRFDEPEEISAHAEVGKMIQADVDSVNARLAHYEQVKRIALLPAELTQESGELTPTLKVKRRVIAEKFKTIIESLYAGHS